jgi:ribose transport system permease protein
MKAAKPALYRSREWSLVLALAAMTLVFSLINPIYLSLDNMKDIIDQTTIIGLMALGITGVIISGGIDLSLGSSLALVGVIVAQLVAAGASPALGILAGLAAGLCLGAFNGFLVTRLRLQPFIATLGTMSLFRGLAYILTKGLPVMNLPKGFRYLVDGELGGFLRISVFIFLGFALLMQLAMKLTRFGNYAYAIGGNEESARLSGVRVDFHKVMIYAVGMLGTALAAIVLLGKLGTGEPTAGQGYELNAIAAVAIGGTSMAGGRGGIAGTVLGAILFAALRVGLIVAGVETFYQYVATGAVIVIAAYAEVLQSRMAETSLKA